MSQPSSTVGKDVDLQVIAQPESAAGGAVVPKAPRTPPTQQREVTAVPAVFRNIGRFSL
ncbi:hypothetical protein BDY19DRAFT_934219 [Irpex rosettiformis]|uniref:Uncharacterized protein n=1 Tax=Irpex rosettiformis TaxID=378272 RepID=A0ACB8UA17_9APHY|nr:hypothetical protein BDY19DRAFT_934219 [Irpex rosettiformis]